MPLQIEVEDERKREGKNTRAFKGTLDPTFPPRILFDELVSCSFLYGL